MPGYANEPKKVMLLHIIDDLVAYQAIVPFAPDSWAFFNRVFFLFRCKPMAFVLFWTHQN